MKLADYGALVAFLGTVPTGCGRKLTISAEHHGIAWGEPVGGLQAGIAFQEAVTKTEREARFVCYVRNTGDGPLRILSLPELVRRAWPPPLNVEVDGEQVQCLVAKERHVHPASRRAYVDLASGATTSAVVVFGLRQWGRTLGGLDAPCRAKVAFVYGNWLAEHDCQPYDLATRSWANVGGLWTGRACSGTIHIQIAHSWYEVPLVAAAVTLGFLILLLLVVWAVRRKKRTEVKTP